MPYNSTKKDTTWETSSIRKWLNGSFFRSAFSSYEKKMILDTQILAEANPQTNTPAGRDTTDKVFLLSIEEFERYLLTRNPETNKVTNYRGSCYVTPYAKAKGLHAVEGIDIPDADCTWWLRSPGANARCASIVVPGYWEKWVNYNGCSVSDLEGVRPAIWVSLDP